DAQTEFSLDGNGNLTVSGTVTPFSSREVKLAFDDVDRDTVLSRVLALPITTWAYKADPNVRHMGPMAEDFFSAFNLGPDDKGISVTDSAGVAFAAIQGLYERIAEREATVARENAELARRNRDLEDRLARLETALGTRAMSAAATVAAPQ
ncbi:MAG TPA: tail fiber domain-containing protein, partial [Thermoanaerobaculia bacterium]|nr:tail fiber domain-containing protein [Thermoanaerobaculia bacterium]